MGVRPGWNRNRSQKTRFACDKCAFRPPGCKTRANRRDAVLRVRRNPRRFPSPLPASLAEVRERRAFGRLAVRTKVGAKAIAGIEKLGQDRELNAGKMGRRQPVVGPLQIGRDIQQLGTHLHRGYDNLHGRSPRRHDSKTNTAYSYFGLFPARDPSGFVFLRDCSLFGMSERPILHTNASMTGSSNTNGPVTKTPGQNPSHPRMPPRRGFGRVRASLRKPSARSRVRLRRAILRRSIEICIPARHAT